MSEQAAQVESTESTEVSQEASEETKTVLTGNIEAGEATEGAIESEGNLEDFINSLPENLRSKAAQKGFKSIEDVFNSYNNLESKLGKRLEDLTDDEVKQLNQRFGAPEDVDGYELSVEDSVVDESLTGAFKEKALELGLPKDKAEGLFAWYNEIQAAQIKEFQAQAAQVDKDNIAELKQEFGSAFDQRVSLANQALQQLGGDDAIKAISEAGLANNPALVKMLSEVGKLISEDDMVGTKKDSATFGITPKEASEKIAELYADKAFMKRYTDKRDPGHKEAFDKLTGLYKIKNRINS